MPQAHASFPLFTLGVVSISVFTAALYLRTGADLLLAIMVHWLANVCGAFAANAGALHHFFVAEAMVAALVVSAGGLSPNPCDQSRAKGKSSFIFARRKQVGEKVT